jgi:undecaprenyl diphosphate synthase
METPEEYPEHIAIIMDGNGRWAKSKKLPVAMGHKKGAESARKIITAAQKKGIRYLTLYAFSSENWNRPQKEIDNLMKLLEYYLRTEKKSLDKSNIKIRVIGNLEKIPASLRSSVKEAKKKTSSNTGMSLIIALSYGGRQEIVDATKSILLAQKKGELSIEDINEKTFTSFLYTAKIPDPDLLIRTSGELRISNFLLWQSAYTEFYFTPVSWPDFKEENFEDALSHFKLRKRNYGK